MNTRLRRPRWIPVFSGAALGLALAGSLLVSVRTEAQRVRYQLAEIEAQTRTVQEKLERLRRERQSLAAPARIRRLALEQGLIDTAPGMWIPLRAPRQTAALRLSEVP